MKRNNFTLMFALVMSMASLTATAQTTTYTIGHFLRSITSTGHVEVSSVTYDKNGFMYACGSYTGTITFSNADHFSTDIDDTGGDAFYCKFDKQGTVVWAKVGGSTTSGDAATAIAVDSNLNVYVAVSCGNGGSFNGITPDNGTYNFDNIALIKLDNTGAIQWAKGGGQLTPTALFVDKNNMVWVAGSGGNAKTFGGTPFTDAEGQQFSGFIMAFDENGATHQHRQIYGDATVTDITGDAAGNIYVTGNGNHDIQVDSAINSQNPGLQPSGFITSYLAKFNNNLQTTWAKEIYTSYLVELNSLTLDSAGNIYVCGRYEDSITLGAGASYYAGGSDYQHILAKYNNAGDLTWSRSYGTEENDATTYRIAYDQSNKQLWATFKTDFGQVLGTGTISQTMAIARINALDGSITQIIQSSTDAAASAQALAVHKGLVGVGGYYFGGTPGTSNQFTLFNASIPYVNGSGNSERQGFVTESTDTTVTVGIENVQVGDASVTLFPNPAHGTFNIMLSDNSLVGSTVAINNLVGQTITEQQLTGTTQQLSLSGMAPGMYLISVKTAKGSITKKLIIE